jgi:hypothetical protein
MLTIWEEKSTWEIGQNQVSLYFFRILAFIFPTQCSSKPGQKPSNSNYEGK